MHRDIKMVLAIGFAYEAAADDLHWPVFLGSMAGAFGSPIAAMIVRAADGQRRGWFSYNLAGWPSEARREYYDLVDRGDDPYVCRIQEQAGVPHLEQETDIPQLRDHGIVRRLGINVPVNGELVGLTAARGADQGAFVSRDLHDIGYLANHVARAIAIEHDAGTFGLRAGLGNHLVDNGSIGIGIVTEGGEVLFASEKLHELSRAHGSFRVRSSRVSFASARADGAFRVALEELRDSTPDAAVNASGRRYAESRVLHVAQVARDDPLLITLIRYADFSYQGMHLPPKARPFALLQVVESSRNRLVAGAALAKMFDLTPAEVRVVEELTTGKPLDQCAAALGVAKNTVRSHLRAIYSKTGTNRQAELISLALGYESWVPTPAG